MDDKTFNETVKKIQKETEYYKSIEGCILDGFSAVVSYDRCAKQHTFMELWPLLSFPQPITKEQALILKKELKKLAKARDCW
ncbi:MAG: hypothetical protein J6U13_00450 [Salinivirgaceae bacterium]|nr:hypothetical protein [Salinivirgaceae bacterium]